MAASGLRYRNFHTTSLGIRGGAVYDALIGAAAAAHGLALWSRDGRAADVYRALGAECELLG